VCVCVCVSVCEILTLPTTLGLKIHILDTAHTPFFK